MNKSRPSRPSRWLGIIGTTMACLAILSASVAAIVVINRTEPTAKQIKATRKSAALVETVTVERGDFSPTLRVLGTVQPAQEIVLSPRVSGQVVEVAPQFLPGGRVRKGDLLLRIDPADFENALSIQESELQQAEASLQIEEGRQSLAQKELKLLEETIDETNRDLVLRAPQIASIRAEVNAAKAAVERAKLDLARSSVFAPFDAQVISRSVNVGSQVSPGDELAQLVGIDEYWIAAAVPVRSLRWIQFPTSDEQGSMVTLENPDAWPVGTQKQARVARMIGTVDDRTRLAQVLVTVTDPLGETTDTPPLILQSLIEVQIEGRPIEDVVRLERRYVRENDTVWVMKEGQLQIRDTEVLFRDADYAYISDGLQNGDEVVTTTLATVAEGVGLRKITDDSDAGSPRDQTSDADVPTGSETSEGAAE
ncbi:efflux RND transporter periplasmic adaptor subunit [Novipirellula caenicola]|uniref:Multidrug resistance protein MdtA n=1 Tax=Novipirellula caenicola TaxID=1536901 RepID=A0ABP9VU99_9BACT